MITVTTEGMLGWVKGDSFFIISEEAEVFTHLSTHPPTIHRPAAYYPVIHPPIHPLIHPPTHLPIHPLTHPHIHPPLHPSRLRLCTFHAPATRQGTRNPAGINKVCLENIPGPPLGFLAAVPQLPQLPPAPWPEILRNQKGEGMRSPVGVKE